MNIYYLQALWKISQKISHDCADNSLIFNCIKRACGIYQSASFFKQIESSFKNLNLHIMKA